MTDLEREYSPSSRVGGDAAPFIADYEARSARAVESLGAAVQVLDGGSRLVVAEEGAPVLVFVHGGYWQALSAAASMYLAPGARSIGWSYAALEYTLAPAAGLPTMVQQVRHGLQLVARAVGDVPLVLAGHSAGAHLAAMVALAAAPPVPVHRTVLVSGVFDLRPLVLTSVNEALGLDVDAAAALSPSLLPVVGGAEVTVVWGDDDTDAFEAQSVTYAAVLRSAGLEVAAFECAARHHFDIVDDLVDPASELGAFTLGGIT